MDKKEKKKDESKYEPKLVAEPKLSSITDTNAFVSGAADPNAFTSGVAGSNALTGGAADLKTCINAPAGTNAFMTGEDYLKTCMSAPAGANAYMNGAIDPKAYMSPVAGQNAFSIGGANPNTFMNGLINPKVCANGLYVAEQANLFSTIHEGMNQLSLGTFSHVISTSDPTLDRQLELQTEIDRLRKELRDKNDEIVAVRGDSEKKTIAMEQYKGKANELEKKENLRHLDWLPISGQVVLLV